LIDAFGVKACPLKQRECLIYGALDLCPFLCPPRDGLVGFRERVGGHNQCNLVIDGVVHQSEATL